jgi:starvation-inducible DNA-binding protein
MNTLEQLTQVFNDNFTTYFRSHVAHVNITGRNFASDHKLLEKVYEDLQEQIDSIAEKIRTLDGFMPNSLTEVLDGSHIPMYSIEGSSETLISDVKDDLEHLKSCYEDLIKISEEEGHDEIANYAQDRVLALAKHIWMLKATLD